MPFISLCVSAGCGAHLRNVKNVAEFHKKKEKYNGNKSNKRKINKHSKHTRVGTLIVATIYLQLIQNRYMFRSFTVL